MENLFEEYIKSISSKFSHKETSEMGYRSDFEKLLGGIFQSIKVHRIDHDARTKQGNKPDFVVFKGDIPILYIETKDIGVSLDKVEKSEQMTRYFGYANLVLTDYLEFRFYRNGERYEEPIKIASYNIKNRTIIPLSQNYEYISKTLIDFIQSHKEPLKSGEHLAKIMGGKAQRIRDNIKHFLSIGQETNSEIFKIYHTLKRLLIHDLKIEAFSDMYAQTLVYGLFVARYHDESPESFTRREASELIPASNPFLGHFFDHIAGRNFDTRLSYIVDELCEVFSHANIKELMNQYFKNDLWGKSHTGPDPVIHFYEDFLKEYDSNLRKKMGAYYTPLPIVNFIVRSVDFLLKRDFNLENGLSDTTKNINDSHKVQVLDPAVGTGTFISAIVDNIHEHQLKLGQDGAWPTYVHHELLPRIYGFELMMAPYTIAHLKISMKLRETGFKYFNETRTGKARLGVYLTNSLEDSQNQELIAFDFGAAITEEAKSASKIKNEKPIMVIVGNPPYSISSSNKSEWIQNLIKDYKRDLHGEQNLNALSDDYVKFIRFAEHFIEKNKTGIVAMITNNSFIDGITHRQMRKHLLETFDDIYILDLHGNSKKKEKTPDGGKDENVFNIMQGVSVNIFIRKNKEKKHFGIVHHSELWGKREIKFEALNNSEINNIKWRKLDYTEPDFFFVPKNFLANEIYAGGFKLNDLFSQFGSGIKFRKDNLLIKNHFTQKSVLLMLDDMNNLSTNELLQKYNFNETKDWKLNDQRKLFFMEDINNITKVLYRPFDKRHTYFPVDRIAKIIPRGDSRVQLMKNLLKENIALLSTRNFQAGVQFDRVFVSKNITEIHAASDQTYIFPLYLYIEDGSKIPNLKKEIIDEIEKIVGEVTPEDVFDYIYAVLHSPSYREKYKEFLKIDFPRIPYPKDKQEFGKLILLGEELRKIHLLESQKINNTTTTYPIIGSNVVEKVTYKDGRVFINKNQYFGNVPEISWGFYIGGYQPAQKWLKDRKGRELLNSDIEHYQKIIAALMETDRIVKEIDKIYKID